ncbi:hypothetical protein OS493_019098 [Desmophyllum pertusum]|uniref:Uncharacterized protein n=1 Tax=Desmophyllum pertusum TaxID=174260 RepID=A0A9X0CKA1_9CNID|nr:hypothetical protein OS493_019098 [Desmophyllum pertusum]
MAFYSSTFLAGGRNWVTNRYVLFYQAYFSVAVLGSNFDLKFKRKSTDDMVLLKDGNGIPSMRYFTVAQFVRAESSYKSGTLFSYSVAGQPEETIVLSFTESKVHLAIKDEIVSADFKLADDLWHYVGVVWNGVTGVAYVYIDGPEIKKATNVQTGNTITGGGWVVLGQRYLAEEKTSVLSTAFVGTLHQSSLWDVPATADHMWNAAHNCTWPIAGSVRAWSSFLPGIKGQVEKRFMTQCKALDMCTTNCSHFFHCESRQGLYHCTCQAGFSGPHCNININDCSSNLCVHGKCEDGINRFDCVCDKGYWGTNCEKEIISEEECPKLKNPRNGKTSCRKVSGRMLCMMSCDEGHSFNAGATTVYGCGPDTTWKWNDKEDLTIPACSRKAAPKEIEHRYSITFVGIQCKSIQSHQALRSAIEKEINVTLSTIPGCHACQLKEVTVPQCPSANQRKRRATLTSAVQVLFSLVVKKADDSSSSQDNVEEKSAAVLFQMQYAVATGQFAISLHGVNSTADRSSLQHLSSNVTCSVGFVTSVDGKGCVACPVGTFYEENSFKCKPCDKNKYQDEEGQTSCKTCDERKSTNSFGAASSDDCIKDDSSGKTNTGLYIALAVVIPAVVIAIVGIIVYCRLRHFCCFADKPKLQQGSRRYTDPDNEVAENNQIFILKERRSSQEEVHSREEKEPIYSVIPEESETRPVTYENTNVGHYQPLNNANEKTHYAELNTELF